MSDLTEDEELALEREELAIALTNAQRRRAGMMRPVTEPRQCNRNAYDDADAVLRAGFHKIDGSE
ncbi:hypothetical protein BMF89_07345 [Arthrobacter sp. SRS-W-1-2016]|uniref:hypothetical protein n=1 Tax=Arthrobacter sp. SRS-W-1-2016 TaxID=1930254 RepID=UPI000990D6D9|nr:hypothetical protein [Arthrobacter sp. SRS-W-1-2016]OOP63100.1 hypothetical protein BMF89_07345 [Arthrobacter sp. SRS-W-1-2016]